MSAVTEPSTSGQGQEMAEKRPKPLILIDHRGLVIRSMEDAYRFSCAAWRGGMTPVSKGKSVFQNEEAVMIAVIMGMEVGLPPMAAIQSIAVINGRPALWGDAMLGVCRSSGKFDDAVFHEQIEGTGDGMTATCTVRRLPDGKPITHTFSIADARRAGLMSKDTYKNYPQRMIQMRARSWSLRDAFTDILKGFQSAEETSDYIDIQPVAAPATSLDALADQLRAEAQPAEEPPEIVEQEASTKAVEAKPDAMAEPAEEPAMAKPPKQSTKKAKPDADPPVVPEFDPVANSRGHKKALLERLGDANAAGAELVRADADALFSTGDLHEADCADVNSAVLETLAAMG